MLGLGNVCLKRTSLRHRSVAHLIDRRIPVTDVMSQALCTRMESWRDKTFQRSILVVGVGPLSTLHSFSAGPVLIAHILLIHVQRVANDIRTFLVALLSPLHS